MVQVNSISDEFILLQLVNYGNKPCCGFSEPRNRRHLWGECAEGQSLAGRALASVDWEDPKQLPPVIKETLFHMPTRGTLGMSPESS